MIWGTPHFRKPARLCAAACFCALALQDGPLRTLIVFCLISDCRICGWWMVDLKHQQFSFWPHELRYVFFFITRLPWLVISYQQSTAQIAQPLAQKGSCWNDKTSAGGKPFVRQEKHDLFNPWNMGNHTVDGKTTWPVGTGNYEVCD